MNDVTVLLVTVDGQTAMKRVSPDLDGFQTLLDGGYLEGIGGDGWSGYVDEEGKIKGLPINRVATVLAWRLGWPQGDVLCGPVVLCGPTDEEGFDTSVSMDLLKRAMRGWPTGIPEPSPPM